jgi:hypothetical protein
LKMLTIILKNLVPAYQNRVYTTRVRITGQKMCHIVVYYRANTNIGNGYHAAFGALEKLRP